MTGSDNKRLRGVKLPYLAAWRKYQLMTQSELADRANVARATVNRAEGGGAVSLANAKQLAEALGVTPQRLFVGPPEGYTEVPGAA